MSIRGAGREVSREMMGHRDHSASSGGSHFVADGGTERADLGRTLDLVVRLERLVCVTVRSFALRFFSGCWSSRSLHCFARR